MTKISFRQQCFAMVAAFCATGAALAAAGPAAAQAEPPVVLVDSGDMALSCDALAEQINALAAADVKPKKKKKGLGFGSLTSVLGMASPVLGNFGGSMGGAIAGQALGTAQSMAMQAKSEDQIAASKADGLAAQRKQRLMGIFKDKSC